MENSIAKLILTLISTIIFTTYVVCIWKKFGVLRSISASFERLIHKEWFLVFTWGTAIFLMLAGESGLSFGAGIFLMFSGISIRGKYLSDELIHMIGATGAIFLGYLFVWLNCDLLWLASIGAGANILMWISKFKNHTWWIEVLAFYVIIAGLFIHILKL